MTAGTVDRFDSTTGSVLIGLAEAEWRSWLHFCRHRGGMREVVESQKADRDMERDNKSGEMSACILQAA